MQSVLLVIGHTGVGIQGEIEYLAFQLCEHAVVGNRVSSLLTISVSPFWASVPVLPTFLSWWFGVSFWNPTLPTNISEEAEDWANRSEQASHFILGSIHCVNTSRGPAVCRPCSACGDAVAATFLAPWHSRVNGGRQRTEYMYLCPVLGWGHDDKHRHKYHLPPLHPHPC